ncbi:MAG TPA: VTT domain-containing protein, partial [Terriglobia bacterium]|nr:VTT domain-containing protein [Terriglobia bacterium]
FFWLLAEQAALPIPSVPLLLVSGALARMGELKLSSVFIYAAAGCLIADSVWFQLGRRYSAKALQFICKMSLEPDSCVRRTENVFVKYGLGSLLVSKFIPGLNVVAAPLAGGSGANFGRFLLFDSLGTLLWVASYVFAGYVFSDQLELAAGYAIRMGSGLVLITICGFTAWILWKLFQRRRFLKSVNVARISADELRAMLSAGSDVTIVDVRSNLGRDVDSFPGALRIPSEELSTRHEEIPRDREIVLFCT